MLVTNQLHAEEIIPRETSIADVKLAIKVKERDSVYIEIDLPVSWPPVWNPAYLDSELVAVTGSLLKDAVDRILNENHKDAAVMAARDVSNNLTYRRIPAKCNATELIQINKEGFFFLPNKLYTTCVVSEVHHKGVLWLVADIFLPCAVGDGYEVVCMGFNLHKASPRARRCVDLILTSKLISAWSIASGSGVRWSNAADSVRRSAQTV